MTTRRTLHRYLLVTAVAISPCAAPAAFSKGSASIHDEGLCREAEELEEDIARLQQQVHYGDAQEAIDAGNFELAFEKLLPLTESGNIVAQRQAPQTLRDGPRPVRAAVADG